MSEHIAQARAQLLDRLKTAVDRATRDGALPKIELPAFELQIPANRDHGDWSCNFAMVSAKAMRRSPRQVAEAVLSNLDLSDTVFNRSEIAGPGFINFFYQSGFYAEVLLDVCAKGDEYGKSQYGGGERVMVEFVSANPTGPMHIGNARGGALGDCLSSVLQAAGFSVAREFYVNDAGNQLEKFALSLDCRYRQIVEGEKAPEMPEDSYQGADIIAHAQAFADEFGDSCMGISETERRKRLVDFALPKNIEKMKGDMAKYGIHYDRWFFESELHKSGEVGEIVELMKTRGLTYEHDGAIWYRATALGAEKDEVLIRQNGNPTYFTVDIAYHKNKFSRGFSRLINLWGADHHGHVARMKTAMEAIGEDKDKLDIVLYQMVNLMQNGEIVRMSKRTGKAIQLSDLLDEVSRDAARFTFNTHEPNVAMDFDLDIAVKQDAQNPVYYVQYAHARICSILKNLRQDGIEPRVCSIEELNELKAPEEIELIRSVAAFTDEVARSANLLDPSVITKYVINVATQFHKFYNACRVKGEVEALMQARLCLCICARTVIRNVLVMFGISAPESM